MDTLPRKFRGVLRFAVGGGALVLVLSAATFVSVSKGVSSTSPQAGPAEPVTQPSIDPTKRVFISGTLLNLRETAAPTATVIKQVPIATECAVEEKAASGWWRIRCGDVQGWAAAGFLSSEKPTVEALLADSADPKRPLKERFDAALRAVTVDPSHAGAQERFWGLFVEQELAQVEDLLSKQDAPPPQLHASVSCEGEGASAESCLEDSLNQTEWSHADVYWRRFETRLREREGRRMFVLAALEEERRYSKSDPPKPARLWIRVGTFEGDAKDLNIQVFTVSRYVPSDTLKGALVALPARPVAGPRSSILSPIKSHLSADEMSLLRPLSGTWTKLTRSPQGLVIESYCDHQTPQVTVKLDEDSAEVHVVVGQDGYGFQVMGVQRGKGGLVTLRKWNGHSLTQSAARDEERLVRWTDPAETDVSGLFVHETEEGAYSRLAPTTEECRRFYEGDDDAR